MEVRIFVFLLRRVRTVASIALFFTGTLPVVAAEAPLEEDQTLTPKVKRSDAKISKIDTEDFEVGVFGGIYSIEDFGSNMVVGARVTFHITESMFLEGSYGQTEADRTTIENVFNVDFLTEEERKLKYYNIMFGYNLFPGEAFIGENWAFVTAFYFIGGAGSTEFGGEDRFSITGGMGYRFLATDWLAARFDFRDHIFDQDILGEDKTTHNLELSAGFSIFF